MFKFFTLLLGFLDEVFGGFIALLELIVDSFMDLVGGSATQRTIQEASGDTWRLEDALLHFIDIDGIGLDRFTTIKGINNLDFICKG